MNINMRYVVAVSLAVQSAIPLEITVILIERSTYWRLPKCPSVYGKKNNPNKIKH